MSKRSLPWLQFYPSDWLSDSVAGCCLGAQGLWLRMLFVAHNSQRYGYLEADGKPIPDEQLARRCGCASVEEYRNLLAELSSAGVPARTTDGVIYSRRMVRDQEERSGAADRQRKHRSHASVTPLSQGEVRSQNQKSETEVKKEAPATPSLSFSGQYFTVTTKQDAVLGEAFPWIDRPAEYRKVDSWLEANPERRPKKANRFLHNWFSRITQSKGRDNGKKLVGDDLTAANLKAAGFVQ
jgi:hypothetical protein